MTTNNQPIRFGLSDGFIEVANEILVINDKAKKDRILLLITTILSLTLSLSILYKWTQNNDKYYILIGLILLITNLGLLWKWHKEFRFIENQIPLSDIAYFKLVNIKLSDTKVGLIRTKKETFRRVKMKSYELNLFRNYMETKSINVIS